MKHVVTVYDSWRNGRFERYCFDKTGKKVILEQAENQQPPFVKGKTCKHGIEKGWRCWKCGGIAVIDVLAG